MDLFIKEKTKTMTGRFRVTKAKLETPEHFALNDQIVLVRTKIEKVTELVGQTDSRSQLRRLNEDRKALSKEMIGMIQKLNRICKTEVKIYNNIVPTVGRTLIANNLTDATPDNTMLITHALLGSSGTAVANGDTTLGAEVYRNVIASITNASNVAYATGFFSASETSGTYAEAGIVSDGTGTIDTGILVSHVLITVTKSGSETLTIDWELTIN